MATFNVLLQKAGEPASAKTEALDAHDIAEAWELARSKYYVPIDDPTWSEFQIVRIEPQEPETAAVMGSPLFADPAMAGSMKQVGPVQGEPGYVAQQGVSLEKQMEYAKATGEKQDVSTETEVQETGNR